MNINQEVDLKDEPSAGSTAPRPKPDHAHAPTPAPPDALQRQMGLAGRALEAMRLGVVPQGAINPYTVGRDVELELVHADLKHAEENGGAIRAFLGDYGAGKTHLLELISEHALAQNFLVAKVVLNPQETAPSHPKRVYRELIRSLQYPEENRAKRAQLAGGTRSLSPLFAQALQSPEAVDALQLDHRGKTRDALPHGAHLYLTPALRYFRQITQGPELCDEERAYALNLLFDWLEGHPTISTMEINDEFRHILGNKGHIYSMKDYRPWARIYGYLLSGLSALARYCGYKGLVLLVDEAEFYSLLSKQNREYAQNLFKALTWASVGANAGMLPFSREELNVGGNGILQDLPPQYGSHLWGETRDLPGPGIYTVFAMTPNTEGLEVLAETVPPDNTNELSALTLQDYQELVNRVFTHYERARPGSNIDPRMVGALGKVVAGFLVSGYIENPRQAMKFIVEFLDLATHRPDDMRQVVQDLRSITS